MKTQSQVVTIDSASLRATKSKCNSAAFACMGRGFLGSSLQRLFSRQFFPSKRLFSVRVEFITADGESMHIEADPNKSILAVAHENNIDLEGACEGSLACSTCHVILDQESFKKLPEASLEEDDMLDLAFGLTETSRLGCQVNPMEGMKIQIPSATRNIAVDGYKPPKH